MIQATPSIQREIAPAMLYGVRIGGGAPVDIRISSGAVESVVPAAKGGGGVILPVMSDIHVHLDKTYTVDRTGGSPSSLFDAIELMKGDLRHWTEDDIRERASRALDKAWRHGVGMMRSHVDWVEPEVPLAWGVLNELRQEWRGRIELQLVGLTPIDLLYEAGNDIAKRVSTDTGVLGAFAYRNDALDKKIDHSFELAHRYELPLDFHVDEGLDDEARGFELIVSAAERSGADRQVLCGHACSLSVQDAESVARVLERAANAGVGLVALPTTNSHLQDRSFERTPRLRGLAPVKEARAAGMHVMLASDNVADVFYPYGDYDLFDVFRLGVFKAHLEPQDWLDAITDIPARWCGGTAVGIGAGSSADFIHYQAADLRDLLSRTNVRRQVWRAGVPIESQGKD